MVLITVQGLCVSSSIGCWSVRYRCFLARVDQVLGQATRVLGTYQNASVWLTKPAFGLGWTSPCRVLTDAEGYRCVSDYLVRIEYGVY